jgi:hypothetical protein
MTKLTAVLFAITLCVAAGCASRGGGSSDRSSATGGSGITVFGTMDAAVSGSKNR